MNLRLLPTVLLLSTPALAQTVLAQGPPTSARSTLQMAPDERRFFALGLTLARGAFAYAELAKAAAEVAKTRSRLAQVGKLGKLAPLAARNRKAAGRQVAQAAALMRALGAPPPRWRPSRRRRSGWPGRCRSPPMPGPLLLFNRDAARTLSSLNEFETLSSLPEDPALRAWLETPGLARSASVWYGEGEIAGLAQIAAAQEMPDLLPPAQQIATDLRGLRDWLALRLPDMPSPEQAALRDALEAFLRKRRPTPSPGVKSRKAADPGAACRRWAASAAVPGTGTGARGGDGD